MVVIGTFLDKQCVVLQESRPSWFTEGRVVGKAVKLRSSNMTNIRGSNSCIVISMKKSLLSLKSINVAYLDVPIPVSNALFTRAITFSDGKITSFDQGVLRVNCLVHADVEMYFIPPSWGLDPPPPPPEQQQSIRRPRLRTPGSDNSGQPPSRRRAGGTPPTMPPTVGQGGRGNINRRRGGGRGGGPVVPPVIPPPPPPGPVVPPVVPPPPPPPPPAVAQHAHQNSIVTFGEIQKVSTRSIRVGEVTITPSSDNNAFLRIRGDSSRRYYSTGTVGYRKPNSHLLCASPGCNAELIGMGAHTYSRKVKTNILLPEVARALNVTPLNTRVWRSLSSTEDNDSRCFHSASCNQSYNQVGVTGETAIMVNEDVVFTQLNANGLLPYDLRRLEVDSSLIHSIRVFRSSRDGDKLFDEFDRQLIQVAAEVHEGGRAHLPTGYSFFSLIGLIFPECTTSPIGRNVQPKQFIVNTKYFDPPFNVIRRNHGQTEAGSIRPYSRREDATEEDAREIFELVREAILFWLYGSRYLCIGINGNPPLPTTTFLSLRQRSGSGATLPPDLQATANFLDNDITDITPTNNGDFPDTCDDIIPVWAHLGLGENANPVNYRESPGANDELTNNFVKLCQALTQMHLLILGTVRDNPRSICHCMLGLKRGGRSLQHIPHDFFAGQTWPGANYVWDIPSIDVNKKRKAMRVLFISLNQLIQHHYPNQTIQTISGKFEYGHDITGFQVE